MSTDQAYQIREKLAQLEAALLKQTPDMPILLREIHKNLKQDPDIVTLLSNEECAILINGLKKQTSTDIAAKALSSGGKKKAQSRMTVADL